MGKKELWKGQLGKVTIKNPTTLLKEENGKYSEVRQLNKGDQFRVYRFNDEGKGYYGVGSGMYVQKDQFDVLYETPSIKNLRLNRIMNGEQYHK